jgi:hypothetical protein
MDQHPSRGEAPVITGEIACDGPASIQGEAPVITGEVACDGPASIQGVAPVITGDVACDRPASFPGAVMPLLLNPSRTDGDFCHQGQDTDIAQTV